MKKLLLTGILLVLTLGVLAQNGSTTFRVKYLTTEFVYLDAGTAKGLNVGDQLAIVRNQEEVIAKVEVVFVAEYSASCKILSSRQAIQPNDIAVVLEKKSQPDAKEPEKTLPEAPPEKEEPAPTLKRRPESDAPFANLSGSISAQVYHIDDRTESNLDFTQPTFRINLRARELWGKEYTLRLRTRSRYNQRTRQYNDQTPRSEWRNRIYELSFSYDDLESTFNYRFGRIISNYMSGVGYIDGLQLQQNLSSSVRFGIFAGTQPNWRDSNFQTSIQKYGAFFNYTRGEYQTQRFESTVAGAAEYHSSVVSREFLYLQNSYTYGAKFNFYQSAELDINRNWRKEKTGQSLTLSNLYLSGRYRFSHALSAGITFDNRKNYWTYEIRSVADSLFDDALRLGLRGNISLRLPGNYFLYTNGGFRKRESDQHSTYSYSAGLNKANFLFRRFSINLNAAGFSNEFTDGYNGSVRLSQSFTGGHRIDVGYGRYAYQFSAIDAGRRNNEWARMNMYLSLLRHLFISGQYEYNWGDDLDGQRMLMELGYRF